MSTREDYRLHYENQDPLEDDTSEKQNNPDLIKQTEMSKLGREPEKIWKKHSKIPRGE